MANENVDNALNPASVTTSSAESEELTGGGPGADFAHWTHICSIASYQAVLAAVALLVMLQLSPAPPSPRPSPAAGVARASEPQTARASTETSDPFDPSDQTDRSDSGTSPTTGVQVPEVVESVATRSMSVAKQDGPIVCDTGVATGLTSDAEVKDVPCEMRILFFKVPLWNQQRVLLLVLLAGMLGAVFRGLGSVAWYVGTRWLRKSWLLQYYIQPIRGAVLGLLFYLLFHGGLFSPTAPPVTTDAVGFMALAALVGVFEKEATAKLKQIAAALFAPHEQNVERANVGAPASTSIVASTPTSSTTPTPSPSSARGTPSASVPVLTSADPTMLFSGDQTPAVISVLGTHLTGATFSIARDGMPMTERTSEYVSDSAVQVTLLPEDVETPGRLHLQASTSAAGTSNSLDIEVLGENADLP